MKKINFLVLNILVLLFFSLSCTNTEKKEVKNVDTIPVVEEIKGVNLEDYDRFFNDAVRLLAGLPSEEGSVLMNLDSNKLWQAHQDKFGGFFDKVKTEKHPKMHEFQKANLAAINDEMNTLFYPFSGPDFIHANIFFPNAKKTVMIGLEPVGDIPDPATMQDPKKVEKFFKAIDIALDSIFRLGYFMTFEMGRNFNRVVELNGTVPIISIFMAQTDHRILDVKRVVINENGEILDSIPGMLDEDNPKDNYISGGKITYMKEGDLEVRELFYFSHDVSKKHLEKTPGFMKFLNTLEVDVTFLKAASYLMGWMDHMREFALEKSKYVFQDDSGIPYKYFGTEKWDFQFWGKYQRTLKVFKPNFQKDLRKIYLTDSLINPLDFGIGYGIRIRQSNLMLATKKITD